VIAMTAHAMSEDREKSLQAGMNDQVNKPIDPDELLAAIAKCTKISDWISLNKINREEADAEDFPWSSMPSIMFAEGLKRVGSNRELYMNLLLKFRASNADTPDNIKTALSKGDNNTASRLVHTVKGVAANIGANKLAAAASELETALIHRSIAVNDLFENFIVALTDATDEIKAFEETFAVPNSKILDKEIIYVDADIVRPYLTDLAQMLESGSIKSVEQLSVLDRYLLNTKVEKQFEQLKKDVDMFDMDSALGKLKAIASYFEISL
ncbi:MAG: Hpt domain-containing protein, partial [Clostridiales bacterium]|nr:Hpt domain-containing protein [Clostridiales bacterium]